MGANAKTMKSKNVTRLKTLLLCHRVLLVLTILISHVTETSPYLARRSGQFHVTFPATNHLGKDFTRHIQRRADSVGSYSSPQATRVLISANTIDTNKLGMIPVTLNVNNDTPSTLNTLMTPPPPTTTTDTSIASTRLGLSGFTNNFYRDTNFNKEQRYAVNFNTGSGDNLENRGRFRKNSHINSLHKSYFDEKEEASKRYATNFHSGASKNFNMRRNDETSTSSSNIIADYTTSSSTTNNYDNSLKNNNYFYDPQNTNINNQFATNQHHHNTHDHLLGKGFTGSSSTTINHIGHHDTKQQHHLHNIKQQLLQNTGLSNNFHSQSHQNNHLHTNHLGTGSSNNFPQHNINNKQPHLITAGSSASLTSSSNASPTGFARGINVQSFPTTASATVGASISFSQNSAQNQFQNNQQQTEQHQQQQPINQNWQYSNNQQFNQQQQIANRNFNNQQGNHQNFANQVNVQNFQQNQQQNANAYPTGFDPRSQSKLPWAHNRFPTQYRPPSAASAPSGGSIPFAHHHVHPHNRYIHHGTTGASTGTAVTAVRPAPGQVVAVTQSPITPTFGFGTTGSQYAAVRDPAQLPTQGRKERVVTQSSVALPSAPAQQQTPPPPPKSTTRQSTTLSTTTQKIEKIQDTTEPMAAASEAESKFVESSTSRAGYGWGPEGQSSGGNEEGGIANVFVDIVTSKIKSIQSTITGIQTAIKSAKRSSARKIATKIEGIGQFVNAVTKGVGGIFEAKANGLSDNKGWGKSSGGGKGSNGGGYGGGSGQSSGNGSGDGAHGGGVLEGGYGAPVMSYNSPANSYGRPSGGGGYSGGGGLDRGQVAPAPFNRYAAPSGGGGAGCGGACWGGSGGSASSWGNEGGGSASSWGGGGFGNNGGNGGFGSSVGSSNIPESPNFGIGASSSAGGGSNVQGRVVSAGNPNPFEGTTGTGGTGTGGGYSWNQG